MQNTTMALLTLYRDAGFEMDENGSGGIEQGGRPVDA